VRKAFVWFVLAAAGASCSQAPAAVPADAAKAPVDAQHAGITAPHGDHTPHHGGMVLMNGDVHYEVVLAPNGAHRLWFSDAVREDLPASLASDVTMTVVRKTAPVEEIVLAIDDSGESWVANGRPLAGDDAMVKVSYRMRGEPFEIEIPFVPPQ
jgi:hypothetical protein